MGDKGHTLDGVVSGALLLGEHLEVHQAEVDERATPVVPHADDSALACFARFIVRDGNGLHAAERERHADHLQPMRIARASSAKA
jgi:hypothetical protein